MFMRTWFLTLSAFLLSAAAGSGAELMAGAAKRRITPELKPDTKVWMAGFANGRAATGVHDDLWVRCLAISTGSKPVAICAVDTIGLFFDDVRKIREGARAKLGRELDVIVTSTHVHEGPDTMGLWGPQTGVSGIDDAYNQSVIDLTVDAVAESVSSLRPATARAAGVTPKDVARFFDDGRPPIVHDPEILVLAVDDMSRKRMATLINWANHPEALGSRNTLLTADWPFALVRDVEQAEGGVAVFVNGAVGGMQSPLGARIDDPRTGQPAPANTFRFAEVVGEYVAWQVLNGMESERAPAVTGIEYREALIEIPVSNQSYLMASQAGVFKGRKPMSATKSTQTPVGYLKIEAGGKPILEAAVIPGEMYPELSIGGIQRDPNADFPDAPAEKAIKSLMTAPVKMLFGLANDEIGYIIPKVQWDEKPPYTFGAAKRWYGEVNSVGPEAAPMIAEAFAKLITKK